MSFDSPFVEYLIIGAHTSSWIAIMILSLFQVPLTKLLHLDATIALLLLPFLYLVGMLADSTVHYPLELFRKRIRDSIIQHDEYKDEFIAFSSPELYSAYDVRIRRVRIMGAAIFNWLFLGLAVVINLGAKSFWQSGLVVVCALLLSLFSAMAWRGLYQRAYRFRKNACDTIREGIRPSATTNS
ncbi:MAG: hypothetical protein R3C18_18010 [Planctomycetaceae bacterium]